MLNTLPERNVQFDLLGTFFFTRILPLPSYLQVAGGRFRHCREPSRERQELRGDATPNESAHVRSHARHPRLHKVQDFGLRFYQGLVLLASLQSFVEKIPTPPMFYYDRGMFSVFGNMKKAKLRMYVSLVQEPLRGQTNPSIT